jgi:hypothetical protein
LNSLQVTDQGLVPTPRINEADLFSLNIAEGCVINKLVQGGNIAYDDQGHPLWQIACCLLKEEMPAG